MNAELWKRVDELLDAAQEVPAAERESFVRSECGDNQELCREVLSLLSAQNHAGTFMAHSAMRVAAKAMAGGAPYEAKLMTPGQEIDNYTIERLLGSGGMGQVYLATESKLNRKVALKILPPEFITDIERAARFEREAQVLSALNHPNLVTIYEVGRFADTHFIAMEFIEGRTLREMASGGLKLKDALSIAVQVAEALSAAHAAGIIHRDIKPDNIMVRGDGYVKVLDFGLAKLTEIGPSSSHSGPAPTMPGTVMGTLAYMSPEQATGEVLDQRTDIWSLGVVLYELLTGESPFKQEVRVATINAILNTNPDSVRSSNAALPPDLDHIISRALEKDPELRYQTASDFRADLRRVLREIDSDVSGSDRIIVARKRRSRRTLGLIAAMLGVIVVSSLITWQFLKSSSGKGPDWSRGTHTQLTDHGGIELFPSLSVDGKSFVYAARHEGNYDLFLQRVGGKNPTNLTRDSTRDDTQPAFSPDGDHIAFRSEREPAGIYVMEATGENLRRVADVGFHPAWSPDGKEIVFSLAGREMPDVRNTIPSALWIVNVASGIKRLLSNEDAMQPQWSPHNQRIAYWFNPINAGRRDIATIPVGGGPPVVVTKDGVSNWNPVWSPDGRYLYFASDRGGNMNFWRVAVNEQTGEVQSEPEAIVTPSRYSRHLSFSGDGTRMAYVQTDDRANIQAVEFDQATQKTIGVPVSITRGDHLIIRPELSADGKRFVIRLPRRTQDDLVVMNADGSNWRDLTNDKFFDRYPRWSPDGKRVAFASDRSGNYEIWTIDVDGNNLRQLTFASSTASSFPIWNPNGQEIICNRNHATIFLDVNKNWNEQSLRQLPSINGQTDVFVAWDWSPDGKKLVGSFRGVDTGLGIFSFETKSYEKLTDWDAQPAWLPDSRHVVFAREGKTYIADVVSKKIEPLILPVDFVRTVAVSPDGHLLYFTAYSSESDIWLLDLK
ncbi:MAG TPA: protein kinase [Pyrinomonadaceae bacterium]|nr:protein kinase [Pyrinomonadaceae bacterium]